MNDPKPLFVMELTDKPVGYAVGNKGRGVLRVAKCPVCNRTGIPHGTNRFLHTLRYFDFYGEAKLSTDGACELPKPSVAARVAKRKL